MDLPLSGSKSDRHGFGLANNTRPFEHRQATIRRPFLLSFCKLIQRSLEENKNKNNKKHI